mgnify:FL=1
MHGSQHLASLFNLARDIRCGFQKTHAARKSFALSLIVSHESIFALQLIACVPRRNAVSLSFLRLRFAIVGIGTNVRLRAE